MFKSDLYTLYLRPNQLVAGQLRYTPSQYPVKRGGQGVDFSSRPLPPLPPPFSELHLEAPLGEIYRLSLYIFSQKFLSCA